MMRRRLVLFVIVLLLLFQVSTPTPAAPAAGAAKLTSVEGITEYRLSNGLRVLLFPDPSKETITVNITYLVGSRQEGYGETGMAHLLEHMVFKGTPKHADIPQELTAHGARPNGSTSYDRTNYFETFAATDENLEWALDLESDRMVHSYIAKKDLDSEMTVVRNEFEIGENSPQNVLVERMMSTAYLWHNYGKSTIGSRADLERVPIESLQAFYGKWYQPDAAILVVAGKFDEGKALDKIVRLFGPIPKPARALPSTWTAEPAQDGERTVTLRRVGDIQLAGVAYHAPAGSHADFPAVDFLTFILGDTPSGRLHKALVETKKASSVFGFAWQLKEPGVLLVGAEVRTENSLEEAKEAMLRAVDEIVTTKPVTSEEVERARQDRLRAWETTMRNSEWAAIELSEWASMGDWRLMFLHRDRIESTTAADVDRVAKLYLKPENRTVGLYLPTKDPARADVPEAPDVAALVKDYRGRVAMAQGETFDPAPAAIESRVVRKTIAPGMKVVMVPRKTRAATVNVSLTLHLGDEKTLQGRGAAGGMVGSMLMRGTAQHTRQQIQDEIDRLKARVSVNGGPTSASARVETTRENLAQTLDLVAEMLRQPSFPESELELARQETLASLEDSKSDPGQKAGTRLQKHLAPWPKTDPRYVESPEEAIASVKSVTLDDVKRFHNEFYGASTAELAIVGDFDPGETQAQLSKLFAGWKSARSYSRLVASYQDRPAINEMIEAPDKESAVFQAGLRLKIRDDDPDYPALVLGNFMTGGGFLNSRLATRIRRTDGLSYGVGSFFQASPFDQDGYFGSFAIYAPQNAEKLLSAFRDEVAKVLGAGFTDEEIAEAKQGWLQSRRVSRSTDRELAGTLSGREYLGRTLTWDEKLEAKVDSLTNEQIMAAMRKHIDPDRISFVQAGDFAKAKKAAAEAKEKAPAGAAAPSSAR